MSLEIAQMEGFDPYRKWLGIPPHEQPPNHYRLLGIGLFESDPDVISGAADRQMSHVRSFLAGQYAGMAQFLLNELVGARMCLLDPQQKPQYDLWLQQALPLEQQMPPPLKMTPMPAAQVSGAGAGMYAYPGAAAAPAPTPSNVPWASPVSAGGAAGQGAAGSQSPGMDSSADDPLAIGAVYSNVSAAAPRHGRPGHGKKKDDSAIVGIAFALVGVSALIVICFVAMYLSSPKSDTSSENQPLIGPGAPVIIIRKKAPTISSPPKPAATNRATAHPDQGKPAAQKMPAERNEDINRDIDYVPRFDKRTSSRPTPGRDQGGGRILGPINSDEDIRPEDIRPAEKDKIAPDLPEQHPPGGDKPAAAAGGKGPMMESGGDQGLDESISGTKKK
jgi:hypothetical protein